MKILIAIPSYNRPYRIEKTTGHWIKEIKNADVRVFVCPSQYPYYIQTLPSEMVVKGAVQGIDSGYIDQLIQIREYAKENGYDAIWKVDDDMSFKKRGIKKHEIAKHTDLSILEICAKFKDDPEISAIGVSNVMDWLRSEKTGFKPRSNNFSGNYIIRTNLYSIHNDLLLHDDLILYLELKVNGHGKILTYYGLHQDAALGTNEGGLQSFDRLNMSKECYRIMQSKYYPELRLKEVDPEKCKHDIGKAINYTYYKKL